KQHLGLTNYFGRSLAGTYAHVSVVFLTAVIMDHLRTGTNLSLGEVKSIVQKLVFIKIHSGQYRLAMLQPTPAEDLEGLDAAKEVVRQQLFQVSQVKLHEDLFDKIA
ncbi:MAG: hypothetical protein QME40_03465, partial [bacterium]|nr:hypothetical protein [bacterium]